MTLDQLQHCRHSDPPPCCDRDTLEVPILFVACPTPERDAPPLAEPVPRWRAVVASGVVGLILAAGLSWSLYAHYWIHHPELTTSYLLWEAFTRWPIICAVTAVAFWELACACVPGVSRWRVSAVVLVSITAGHLTWILNVLE